METTRKVIKINDFDAAVEEAREDVEQALDDGADAVLLSLSVDYRTSTEEDADVD